MPRDWRKSAPRYAAEKCAAGHRLPRIDCEHCHGRRAELRADREANQQRLRDER